MIRILSEDDNVGHIVPSFPAGIVLVPLGIGAGAEIPVTAVHALHNMQPEIGYRQAVDHPVRPYLLAQHIVLVDRRTVLSVDGFHRPLPARKSADMPLEIVVDVLLHVRIPVFGTHSHNAFEFLAEVLIAVAQRTLEVLAG